MHNQNFGYRWQSIKIRLNKNLYGIKWGIKIRFFTEIYIFIKHYLTKILTQIYIFDQNFAF